MQTLQERAYRSQVRPDNSTFSPSVYSSPMSTQPRPRSEASPGGEHAPIPLLENDPADERLRQQVGPPDWQNPEPAACYNLVVVGGGTAGLVTAAGAAGLGARVALIERDLLGGDCLNVGCVPSKALLRSARVRGEMRRAKALGATVESITIDGAAVLERMRSLRADLAPNDSATRFRDELGVDVFRGAARFTGTDTLEVEGATLRFRRAVIATGASASVPPVPGLGEAGFATNETIFSRTSLPERLVVLGAGPIGCELAQAFRRLGSSVTLLEVGDAILPREDRDAAALVHAALLDDGVDIRVGCRIEGVERAGEGRVVRLATSTGIEELACDELLVATGRKPNVAGLGLEEAGVQLDSRGAVAVDDRLQTTNPAIYAAGDVCLDEKFTHAADFAARLVIENSLFRRSRKRTELLIPRCTYTDPEIASVGITREDAEGAPRGLRRWRIPFSDLDRARLDGEEDGYVEVVTPERGDRIVGATIVASHAGEMIGEVCVAMRNGMGLGSLASVIHAYPTQAEAIRKAGDLYNRTRLTPLVKRLFSLWFRWNR